MTSKSMKFNIPSPPKEALMTIGNFSGINLGIPPTQIADNECVDMRNFQLSKSGTLEKRFGYEKVFNSLGNTPILGMHLYKYAYEQEYFLFAHGTKLYKLNTDNTYTQVYDGLSGNKVVMFDFNNLCYILDGVNYKVYNGTTVTDVVGYIPTLFITTPPGGGGTASEQFNILSSGFKQNFTANGTSTEYVLCFKGLDAALVTVWIEESTGFVQHNENDSSPIFTVDRVNGKVTFATAPPLGNPDNVKIQAFKTQSGLSDRIKKCTDFIVFGGMNDTHVLFYGNPSTPAVVYRSGVVDPTYFPENYYQAVGNTTESIMKMIIQYDSCTIMKEKTIWHMDFELANGEAVYTVRPLNDGIGCTNYNTVQLLDNSPVFLSYKGVYMVTQTNVREEKNIQLISQRVNKLLLKDTIKASYDFDNKYILVGDLTYVFDYLNNAWFIWDNIIANCFIEVDSHLYFGDGNGTIHKFKTEDDLLPYNDNGLAINAYWKTKAFDFGREEKNKLVQKLFVTLAPYKNSGAYFYYVTDSVAEIRNQMNLPSYKTFSYRKSLYNDKIYDAKSEFIDLIRFELIEYSTLTYNKFSYGADSYPQESVMKVKAKKIPYYQFLIQNYKFNEGLSVDSIVIKFYLQNYRK